MSDFNTFNKQYFIAVSGKTYDKLALKEMGLSIVKARDEYAIRNDVLTKLLILFPSDDMLLYYMGYINLNKSTTKSMLWFRQCLDRNPKHVDCLLDYLKILFDNDMFDAIQAYNNDVITDNRLRLVLAAFEGKRRNFEKSIEQYLKIIDSGETDPTVLFMCYSNTGITYNDIDNRTCAVKFLQKAISMIDDNRISEIPICKNAFSNLFISSDYEYLSPEDMERQHKAFDKFVPKSRNFPLVHRDKARKIRVGYVSGDFDTHVVSQFILPILLNHTDAFEVHCFLNMALADPKFTEKITNLHLVQSMSNADLAAYIHKIGIDILIDLSGHTAKNRLEVFSMNPAPVQMTYLGFPNSTGLTSIHYRITDAIADHPKSKQRYSEKLIRMPRCFLLFSDVFRIDVTPKETDPNRIILGALNREAKNSHLVVSAWRRILYECPNAVLLIKLAGLYTTQDRSKYYMDLLGVPANRLIIIDVIDYEANFAKLYGQIDVLLDTFPYSGTTTSCKSLFYSVPIITKYHPNYHVNNVTSSLLINSGFPELVAYSDEEYIAKTVDLIRDPDRIRRYKKEIKPRFEELMEPKAFMKSYEAMLTKCL